MASGVPSLRGFDVFPAVHAALSLAQRAGFRITTFSVQDDHVHLLVEAADRAALVSGARGLQVRLARTINRATGHRGRVMGDRYHVRALRTPREVRIALVYVLRNVSYCSTSLRAWNHESQLPRGGCDIVRAPRTRLLRDAAKDVRVQQRSLLEDPGPACCGP